MALNITIIIQLATQPLIFSLLQSNELRRRVFKLEEPFREIMEKDIAKKFTSELFTACGATLESLFKYDNKDNTHVWVYDANDEILAVLVFEDLGKEFHIVGVSNNFAINETILDDAKPGGSLYLVMENFAIDMGVKKIFLESIEIRTDYWKIMGFNSTGDPKDGKFCKLFPMAKELKQ